MNDGGRPASARILVIDDNQAIHEDFRKIFRASLEGATPSAAELALFGETVSSRVPEYRIDSAYQGQEGLDLVREARTAQSPYALAFVDVRMPPGWDGIETAARIWQIDPDIQIVICTAYSDYSWGEMLAKLGRSDRLVILKKPFDVIEVVQLATALTEKWRLARQSHTLLDSLERRVAERTVELVEARDRLQASEHQYRLLFESNPHPMWVYDLETLHFVAVNDAAVAHYGYARERFLAMTLVDIRPPEDVPALMQRLETIAERPGYCGVWRHRKADGTVIEVEITAQNIDFSGRRSQLVLANDVSARFAQDRRIERLSRIRAVIGGISSAMLRLRNPIELLQEACRVAGTDGVFPIAWVGMLDGETLEGAVVASFGASPALLERIRFNARAGSPELDRLGSRVAREGTTYVCNDVERDPLLERTREELLKQGQRSVAAFPLHVEGRVVGVLVLSAAQAGFFDHDELALLGWMVNDLSFALDHIQTSQRLDYLAYYDALTRLPNSTLFRERLGQLVNGARQDDGKVCVMVLDIERFTHINDSLGRQVGDELLRLVGARFGECLGEPHATGRIGADTFAVARPLGSEASIVELRDRVLDALGRPFRIEGHDVRIAVQAGIAVFPGDGDDGNDVFQGAEAALKLAKSSGARYAYYSSAMDERIARRMALEEELRAAVDARQFVLHFQPRVDMTSGEVIGAEALIRWQHPHRGLVGPGEFIVLAEQTGLIVPIGAWIIESVCAQQARWLADGISVVPIAVNVSTVQLDRGDVLRTVRDALAAHALPAGLVDVEITESAVMSDPATAVTTLHALRELGVGLALDDFGTGYSSLAHLKRFPFDSVKIDRSFVAEITSNAEDAAIATAIIVMAHGLGLKAVAEGVESQGQFNFLHAHRCDEMQGYLFSPAVDAVGFAALLRDGKRLVPATSDGTDGRTLLVVDDEPDTCVLVSRALRRDGYRILHAAGGAEGLELLALHPVQVIIADQRMPRMSGVEFLSTVKALYPDTVRIILSGFTDLSAVTESVNRGEVYKFLTKPWDDAALRDQVRDAFRRYRSAAAR